MNLLGKMRSFTPTARANVQWRFKIARGKTGNGRRDFSMGKGNKHYILTFIQNNLKKNERIPNGLCIIYAIFVYSNHTV